MIRLVLGLIKGIVLGALVGLGAYAADFRGGMHWVTYGMVGAMVGLFVGRPLWSHLRDKNSTFWVSVVKAIVGFGIGCGLYAIVAKAWGGFDISYQDDTRNVIDWQPVLGAAIGAIYGAWVELDDGATADDAKGKGAAKK